MQPFDIVVLCYVALGALRGWGRGLLAMAAGLAGFILAIVVARVFYGQLATFMDRHWHLQHAIQMELGRVAPAGTALLGGGTVLHLTAAAVVGAIAFLAIMFAAEAVIGVVAGTIGRLPNHLPLIGPMNRLAGGVFGALENVVVVAALLLLLEPLAHSGMLGSLSPYIVDASWATQLWHLGQHFAPILEKLP
jgi:uncharacterized membrane protein required for colicin V production